MASARFVAQATLKPFANLTELEELAKPLLTDAAYGYYASGAEGEYTLRDNETALARQVAPQWDHGLGAGASVLCSAS
jgi:hypothetical protein